MINTTVLSWTTFLYLAALLFYIVRTIRSNERWGRVATGIAAFGVVTHTAGLLARWIESYHQGIGHAPLTNFYESLIFFAWAVMSLYLVVEWRIRSRFLGIFITPLAFLMMAYASLSPDVETRIQPLIPALQSNWLTSHVITCFIGYAFFAVAFGIGLIYFLKGKKDRPGTRLIPSDETIDELLYSSAALGFVFLTLGIVTGAVWAHAAWGRYWSWDPKETWSLITWFVYALMLHARHTRGWRGRRMAVLSIAGFVAVLITYLGVNFLPSLHSYF